MNIINKISKELSDDIKLYELELKKSIKSKVGLINTVVNYALKRKGKRFRPLLCILCSRLEGTPNDKTFLSDVKQLESAEVLQYPNLKITKYFHFLPDKILDNNDENDYIKKLEFQINNIFKSLIEKLQLG